MNALKFVNRGIINNGLSGLNKIEYNRYINSSNGVYVVTKNGIYGYHEDNIYTNIVDISRSEIISDNLVLRISPSNTHNVLSCILLLPGTFILEIPTKVSNECLSFNDIQYRLVEGIYTSNDYIMQFVGDYIMLLGTSFIRVCKFGDTNSTSVQQILIKKDYIDIHKVIQAYQIRLIKCTPSDNIELLQDRVNNTQQVNKLLDDIIKSL